MLIAICGKSASGKDTLLAELKKNFGYEKLLSATDRPKRPGEVNGREYHFVTPNEFQILKKAGKLVEERSYHTMFAGQSQTVHYGLLGAELNPDKKYAVILDIEGIKALKSYFPEENIQTFYLDADDNTRTSRCLKRGDYDFTEWNRRLAADNIDFSPEKLSSVQPLRMDATMPSSRLAQIVDSFAELSQEQEHEEEYER